MMTLLIHVLFDGWDVVEASAVVLFLVGIPFLTHDIVYFVWSLLVDSMELVAHNDRT